MTKMFQLVAHPDHPMPGVRSVSVKTERDDGVLNLRYRLEGDLDALVLPSLRVLRREDRLWRSTCFELFLRHNATAYREYNFAPDGRWSAYRFASYRHARSNLPNRCALSAEVVDGAYVMTARVAGQPTEGHRIGLSTIVEDVDGRKSFWAVAHPAGKADFHHDDCFALSGDDL